MSKHPTSDAVGVKVLRGLLAEAHERIANLEKVLEQIALKGTRRTVLVRIREPRIAIREGESANE